MMQSASVYALLAANCAVHSGLILSLGHREPASRWIGAGFLMGAVGMTLLLARIVDAPFILTVVLANALLLASFGCGWLGVRVFESGRASRPPLWPLALGPLLWIAACTVPSFAASFEARAALASWLTAAYACLSALEIWRGRHEPLPGRKMAAILGVAFAAFVVVKAAYSSVLGFPPNLQAETPHDWFWVSALLLTIGFCLVTFLAVTLGYERGAAREMRDACSHQLRVADSDDDFIDRAGRLLATPRGASPVTALAIRFDSRRSSLIGGSFAGLELARLMGVWLRERLGPFAVCGCWGKASLICLFPGRDANAVLRLGEEMQGHFAELARSRRLGLAETAPQIDLRVAVTMSSAGTAPERFLHDAEHASLRAEPVRSAHGSLAWIAPGRRRLPP